MFCFVKIVRFYEPVSGAKLFRSFPLVLSCRWHADSCVAEDAGIIAIQTLSANVVGLSPERGMKTKKGLNENAEGTKHSLERELFSSVCEEEHSVLAIRKLCRIVNIELYESQFFSGNDVYFSSSTYDPVSHVISHNNKWDSPIQVNPPCICEQPKVMG